MSDIKLGLYIVKTGLHTIIVDWTEDLNDLVVYHFSDQVDGILPVFQKDDIEYLQRRIHEGKLKDENFRYIPDQEGARNRLNQVAFEEKIKPGVYNLIGNNCEHFANFVAVGERRSETVEALFEMAGTVIKGVIKALT